MSASLPQRKNLRHDSYDYRKAGAYFVTICIEDRHPLLGRANQDTIILSDAGTMVTELWFALPEAFPSVKLDAFVVMPNHIHFVIWLTASLLAHHVADDNHQSSGIVGAGPRARPQNTVGAGPACPGEDARPQNEAQKAEPSLPEVMQWYKSLTTSKYRHGVHTLQWPPFPGKLWQRSYYEHVVRSDAALYAIRQYIDSNPRRWHLDRYHPEPSGRDEEAIALWKLLQNEGAPS